MGEHDQGISNRGKEYIEPDFPNRCSKKIIKEMWEEEKKLADKFIKQT